jgi:hypothetical protein
MRNILFILFFILSCESSIDVEESDSLLRPEGTDDRVELLGMTVNDISSTGFEVVISYQNDLNLNATGTFYYCNETDDPTCDPLNGTSVTVSKSGTKFYHTIKNLSSPNDPGDRINTLFVVSDPDGFLGVDSFDADVNLSL